jgi:hypothetical protein
MNNALAITAAPFGRLGVWAFGRLNTLRQGIISPKSKLNRSVAGTFFPRALDSL